MVMAPRATGSSWGDCSEVPFLPHAVSTSSGAQDYSAVTFDFCQCDLETATSESQGLASVYCDKWMEMLL